MSRRVSRWDRPPGPKDVRWFLRMFGKILICTGLLMFGFVAYQLWGTGIQYARAQDQAENDFEEMMERLSTTTTPTSSTSSTFPTTPTLAATVPTSPGDTTTSTSSSSSSSSTSATSTTSPAATSPTIPSYADIIERMEITQGDPIGFLEIPEIELGTYIFPGVEREDLQNGPGHFPQTPMPGQYGNSAVAGHRTTYGEPFRNLDELVVGDEITMTMPYGIFVYVMTSSEIVNPTDTEVIATTDPTMATLTLTTCHPEYSASQRLIIHAELVPAKSAAPGQPVFNYGRDTPLPTTEGLPGEDGAAATAPPTQPTTTPTSTTDTEVTVPGAVTGPTSVAESTSSTTALPTTTATADTLYSVGPGGGFAGGDGEGPAELDGEGLSNRWFSDVHALPQVGLWAAACTAVVVGAYQLAKRFKNSWIGLAVAVVPFIIGLYFFYENVNRLLPAAL